MLGSDIVGSDIVGSDMLGSDTVETKCDSNTNGRGECDASRRHPRGNRCAHVRIAMEVRGRSTDGGGCKDGRGLGGPLDERHGGDEVKDRRNGRIQREFKLTDVVQANRRNNEEECDNHRDRVAGASGRILPGRKSVR